MPLLTPRMTYAPFEYDQAYIYWEQQQQSHWLHCVARDQLVVTSNGLMTVEELYKSGTNLKLFNNHKVIKSSPMMRTAHRKLYKIHTKEGYAHTVTDDHRVMTSGGWCEARNLTAGSKICIQSEQGLFGKIHEIQQAYELGKAQVNKCFKEIASIPNYIFKGDAETVASYFQGLNLVENNFSHSNLQFLQNLQILLLNAGINSRIENHSKLQINDSDKLAYFIGQYIDIDESSDAYMMGLYQANADSDPFKEMSDSIFKSKISCIKIKYKDDLNRIPSFVMNGPKHVIHSYLKGLYNAAAEIQRDDDFGLDSNVIEYISNGFYGIPIEFKNIFARDLVALLSKLGINSVIEKGLNISTKQWDIDFVKVSDYADSDKILKIMEWWGYNNFNRDQFYASFSHLEQLEADDVFCVSVDTKDHAWICNGFITHNTEINMASDINDWKMNINDAERNIIGHILKGFTQSEVFIQEYWSGSVSRWFKIPEIQMMAATFAAFESIHAVSYAYLNQSLGLENFEAFLHEPTAKAKIDRLINTRAKTPSEIAKSLAIFSAFNEGVNLFSSFAILLNFSRFNKMKGLGQIIAFSIKDESHHSSSGCWLLRTLVLENPEIWTDELKRDIYDAARLTVELEDNFITAAFSLGEIEGLSIKIMKNFIRHRTNTKLEDIGLKKNWKNIDKNLLNEMAWFDVMSSGVSHSDFFAQRVSDYSRGNTDFSKIWDDV